MSMEFFPIFFDELKLLLDGIWEMMVDEWFCSFEIVPSSFWEPAPSIRLKAVVVVTGASQLL